jgi:large subunit ribosomal protein L17
MVKGLLTHQSIKTTLARAKEVRRLAEGVITLGKSDTVASRRRAYSVLTDRDLVTKLFKEISPLFKGRVGGYTRIIHLGFRAGDGADMAILELTEKKAVEKIIKPKKEKAKEAPGKKAVIKEPEAARAEEAHPARPKEVKEPRKEELKAKAIPKGKPTIEEEKKAEKAKSEEKAMEGKKTFMKNLRGFFRRKTDM